MNPETQRLATSPRSLGRDAFFEQDRARSASTRSIVPIDLAPPGAEKLVSYDVAVLKGRRDRPGTSPTPEVVSVFANRHVVDVISAPNPLRHSRHLPPVDDKTPGGIDASVATWNHDATYTCFLTQAARTLAAMPTDTARLQVKILFGTGSEAYRHGVCGAIDNAVAPTLLVVVSGIEPQHEIDFYNPSNAAERKDRLSANSRWGVGITVTTLETYISRRFGRRVGYDITVLSAFSTGYLGLQGVVDKRLLPLDRLERVVIFDCLYGSLKAALDRVKAVKGSTHVIAYVVTSGGNSFRTGKDEPATFEALTLGGNPAWNYINLMGNMSFLAVTSARLVGEARSSAARIIHPLPADYEAALSTLLALLPARSTLVSNATVMRKVRGALPAGTKSIDQFGQERASVGAARSFIQKIGLTRRCIGRAQLLGWAAPPGEEWHDMLLVEFAWEYLS